MRHLDLRYDAEGSDTIPPGALRNCSGLHSIILIQNFITRIFQDSLVGLESLQDLDMRVNSLSLVEDYAFLHTPNLRNLDLSGNYIVEV